MKREYVFQKLPYRRLFLRHSIPKAFYMVAMTYPVNFNNPQYL